MYMLALLVYWPLFISGMHLYTCVPVDIEVCILTRFTATSSIMYYPPPPPPPPPPPHTHTHTVKTRLEVASSFMILGVIATFVALVLFFPFFHWIVFIVGSIIAFASCELSNTCACYMDWLYRMCQSKHTIYNLLCIHSSHIYSV